ncbi:unnamed protein product [Pleuronectes platessa]|uniref:Uncharacterized protein n=1 Tax=Pleuronectes platessa TaxID=8262 RepID=A0A9N7TYZ0_PLEPL|nr:unnamed protein product [Pleuronectes platessa]
MIARSPRDCDDADARRAERDAPRRKPATVRETPLQGFTLSSITPSPTETRIPRPVHEPENRVTHHPSAAPLVPHPVCGVRQGARSVEPTPFIFLFVTAPAWMCTHRWF